MNFRLRNQGDASGQLWNLPLGRSGVGRGADNSIRLTDRSISRDHAEVLVEESKVQLRDLGSRNGTWVNGSRIEEITLVRPGDRIRFGGVDMILEVEGSSPSAEGAGYPVAPRTGTETAGSSSLVFSTADQIHTSARLSWEELGPAVAPGRDLGLFRAVTEAGQLLMLPRPLGEVFQSVLDLVERSVPARRILLLLVEEEGGEPQVRAARPARALESGKVMLSQTLLDTVLGGRQSLLVSDAQSDPRFREQLSIVALDVHSALVAPLFDNERVIGLIYADTNDPLVRYDEDQLRAFTLLANLIAVKITNTRLLEEQRIMERMEQELATAVRIQRGILPANLPTDPSYEIAARQIPCHEVGGDLYDAERLADGSLAVVVGDVTGKGMGAALLMSHVMASLRLLYEDDVSPAALITRLNRQVQRSTDAMSFVTLFFGRMDPTNGRLVYVGAGHNPPYVIDQKGEVSSLESTGLPIGMLPGVQYESRTIDLPEGGLLCVFSDGITEALVEEEFYGEERLVESLLRHRDRPVEEIAESVLDDLRQFLGATPPADDITLVLVRRLGAANGGAPTAS